MQHSIFDLLANVGGAVGLMCGFSAMSLVEVGFGISRNIYTIFIKCHFLDDVHHRTIYSATTFLDRCRKVVLEKWFCKLRFFFWSTTFLQPEKMWIYGIKTPFFSGQPLFLNQKKCGFMV